MKNLSEEIKNRLPLRVYIDGYDFGIYEFNQKENAYIGFGRLNFEDVLKVLNKKYNFIRLEA